MNCVVCDSQNPEGAKYCGTCGTRLDPNFGPLKEVLEASVRREVDSALQRFLKDQKIAEFDITEKVANRLLGWVKIVAAVVGFLGVVAGLLGVDFVNRAKKGIKKQSDELHEKYRQLNSELRKNEEIKKSVSDQQEKIKSALKEENAAVDKLQQQVVSYLQKGAATGNTDSMYALGDLYKNGWCVAQDYDKARKWYQKAAEKGNPWGMYDLGDLYKNGVAPDYDKAHDLFMRAVDAGNVDALYGLGDLSKKTHDYDKARDYYQKAADAGNPWGMYDLGDLYTKEDWAGKDYDKARNWFVRAVDAGNVDALYGLGDLSKKTHDYDKARDYYQKAADAGNPWGMYDLGDLYTKEDWAAKDYEKARGWLQKAADAGNAEAVQALARLPSK
jgi:TPR repeat protein